MKPGLYLGIGTVLAMRGHPSPFLLRGPYNVIDPWEAPNIIKKDTRRRESRDGRPAVVVVCGALVVGGSSGNEGEHSIA